MLHHWQAARHREESAVASLIKRLGLRRQGYFTGTIDPRKNSSALLSAYERLPLVLWQRYPLVLSGYADWDRQASSL